MECFNSLFHLLCVCVLLEGSQSVTVETKLGLMEGKPFNTSVNRTVHSFLGVPFAKPPIGELRFAEPEPFGGWEGTWMATESGSPCLQMGTDGPAGSEDCLYMDIYTTQIAPPTPLPVLVNVHGGAWRIGKGSEWTPFFLMDYADLVYVTVNYRLDSLGFLSTEDDVVPGNNGLKDQALALRWVRDNVAAFGGDAGRVTIAGLSAGGASVHMHFVSPLSRGLFASGISASGTALNNWALGKRPRQKAEGLAAAVGCPTGNSARMVSCLKTRPGRRLVAFDQLFKVWRSSPFTIFGPVVEQRRSGGFLTEHPYRTLAEGRSFGGPWLAGVASEDGLYPAGWFIDRPDMMAELDRDWLRIAPHLMDYNFTSTLDLDDVSTLIRSKYLGSERVSAASAPQLVKMLTDRLYKVDSSKAVKLQASTSEVFFYVFNYRGVKSGCGDASVTKSNFGVGHGDDYSYVFGFDLSNGTAPYRFETEGDRAMARLMQRVWINFIENGNPTGSGSLGDNPKELRWTHQPEGNDSSVRYLLIRNASSLTMTSDAVFGNAQFWSSLGFAENERYDRSRYWSGDVGSGSSINAAFGIIYTVILIHIV